MSEILAPAGNKNCALAAINAGCDAIYLGLDKFSARSSADNFAEEEFREICNYAHAFNVKVYVALNTIVKESELESFLNSVEFACNNGADALIIQDLFLGKFIKKQCPKLRLHLSTQAGTCNLLGALLAKEYGFDRVILARETKLEDIAEISKVIETEVFVQGALCTCFSGQCYLSSFAGGNSGNRGKCKQPCRKLYSIDRQGFTDAAYRLSLSDLCVGEDIEKLICAGATSFKIEGRMRRPEYVAAAVRYYKNILSGDPSNIDLSNLKRTYNRGNYTKGLAFGQDKNFISSAVQGHIGEFIGIVKPENGRYVCVTCSKVGSDSGFKILRGGKEVGGAIFGKECKGGFTLNTRDRLKSGDKVFITTDASLNSTLLAERRKISVNLKLRFISGERAYAKINGVDFFGDVLSKATSRPVTKDEIIKNFNKVDGYPFSPFCEAETDGVFIQTSALNSFRRRVYAEYYERISKKEVEEVKLTLPELRHKNTKNNLFAVISTDLNNVEADLGILKLDDLKADIHPLIKNFKGKKFLFVPPYLSNSEVEKFGELAKNFDGIYCDGYFGIKLAEKLKKPLFSGTGFNITNSISLLNCPAEYKTLSKELTVAEADGLTYENVFYLSSGNIKVMDLIYCPFEKKCSSCDKRKEYTLTDESGRKFPLRRYVMSECRFEVYNCADLIPVNCLAGKLCDSTLSSKAEGQTHGHAQYGVY